MRERLAEACPRCLRVSYPHTLDEDRGSILAVYRCRTCGRRWRCWWNPACLEVSAHGGGSLAEVPAVFHTTGD